MKKIKTRNKFEEAVRKQLRRTKILFKYESEHIPYYIASHYIPDFILYTVLGKIYVECKGYLRPEDKRKLVAVKKLNPHLDIRILFYAHSEKNIRWANRQGFRWAIEKIPDEWIKGL